MPIWAEEAGVEPTEDACAPSNGFEARAPHRERYSSTRRIAGFPGTVNRPPDVILPLFGVSPGPIPDLRHVLSVPTDVLLVLDQLVLELLLQIDPLVTGLRQSVDR